MAGFSSSDAEDAASLLSIASVKPTPYTLTSTRFQPALAMELTPFMEELVRRLRALTLTLLPLEVNPETINDPTSRIITPKVIAAYKAAAGDFTEAVRFNHFAALKCVLTWTLAKFSFRTAFFAQELSSCGMQITTMPITVKTSDEVSLPNSRENVCTHSELCSYRM